MAGGGRCLPDDLGDLVERDREDIVEHERQPLGGRQRLEHDEKGQPDGVGHDGVALWALVDGAGHDRLREPAPGVVLASLLARPKHVQADPPDHDREPATQIIGASRVAPVEPDPCLLDGVVGLADGTEHPIGNAPEVGALMLELLGQPFLSFHWVGPRWIRGCHGEYGSRAANVTMRLGRAHAVTFGPPLVFLG